jgi:hypothetical protein
MTKNSSFEFFAGYSDVNSGTLQGLFNVAAARSWRALQFYLPKIREYEQAGLGVIRVSEPGGSDRRRGRYRARCHILPLSIAYNGCGA